MTTYTEPYNIMIILFGIMGILSIIQLLVADFTGVAKGHVPGYPVENGHKRFLFRAVRAHNNTNESIAAFILLALFAIFSQANAYWCNAFASVYVLGRFMHMLFYYFDLRIMRSIAFAASIIGLISLFIISIISWF